MGWFSTPQLIRDKLLADATIVAAVGDRVHYTEVPSGSEYPRIWFTRTSKAKLDNLNPNCITIENETYAIEVLSDKNIEELLTSVITVLELLGGEAIPGSSPAQLIQFVQVSEATDDYEFGGVEPGKEVPKFYHAITAQLAIVRA